MPCNKHYCFWILFKLAILTFVLVFPITFDSSAHDATLFAQDDDLEELEENDSQGGNVPLSDDEDTSGDQQEEEEEEELEEDGDDTESADNAGAGSSGSLVEPFDVITFSHFLKARKQTKKVFPVEEPVSVHKPGITPEDEKLVFYLYKNGPQRGGRFKVTNKKGMFHGIEYFEQRVYRDAAKLISIDSEPPRAIVGGSLRAPQSNVEKQKWQKAERLLKAGLSEHDSLTEQALRDERAFLYLRQRLLNALVEMELITIKEHVKNQQFDQAEALCEGLEEHAPEQKHKKRIHQLHEAISLVRGQSLLEEEHYADVRTEIDRLRNKLYPSSPSEKYQAFEKEVHAKAEKLFEEGKRASEQERPKDAKRLLAQAMALSPGLPGLWQASRDASENHEVLNCVFIDALPKNFSPLSTETALDRHAVSMLFEGLVRWSREPFGNCFTAELIEGRAQPLPKGRKFRLKQRQWSDSSQTRPQYLIAEDVRRSLMLAIEFHPAGYPPLWETYVDNVLTPDNNPFVFRFTLEKDYWSPLALMNFSILPEHNFRYGGNPAELEAFNKNPVGTGAYMLNKESGKKDEVHFRVNPYYPDPPSIEEVVFEQQSADEALSQMKEGKIDLLYDVRKDQVEQLERENIDVRSIKSNVVYMLVPNHGRSKSLKTLALRRAISYSINREELLNQFFRPGGKTDTHTSLQGIFPKHSWASHPELEDDSSDANAEMHFKQAKSKLGIHYPKQLVLAFPDRNDVEQACNEIKDQIETISTQAGARITIKLKSYPVEEYDALVKRGLRGEEGSFDLAYWKHEYLDGGFWCESLFDAKSGSNLHNYAEYGDLHSLFTNLRNHKHFVDLRDTSHEIDRHIASYVPIIPLWQLDTFIAFSSKVDLGDREIDPVHPFRDVKSWELK